MVSKKVSIIVVTWNGKKFLKMCLPSLRKIDYPNYEVVVVDNGSTDGSQAYVRKYYPWVKLIKSKTNLGYAAGNNLGISQAAGDYLLLLNNDVEVEPDFLTILAKRLESAPKIACVQPKICTYDNKTLLDAVGSFLTNIGFLYHYGRLQKADLKRFNQSMPIYSPKGAAMLFKKVALDRVGLFDDDFFAYFEETDLAHRLWLAGYKIIYEPKAVIYHVVAGTSLKLLNNEKMLYLSLKNRICSFLKNLSLQELVKIFFWLALIYGGLFFFYLLSFKPKLSWQILRALFWNLKNLKKTLKKRSFVQKKIRKLEDKKLFTIIKKNPPLIYYYYLLTNNLQAYPL